MIGQPPSAATVAAALRCSATKVRRLGYGKPAPWKSTFKAHLVEELKSIVATLEALP